MDTNFSFDAPAFEIIKSYRDTNGQMFLEGIAATTGIDLTGERMSPEVIQKMALGLIGKPLREEHQKGYLNKLGEIVGADVIQDQSGKPALWIKARLYDWNHAAKDTFDALKNGVKLGLSVAGRINPGGLVKEMVQSAGKYVPTYRDVEPTEVSVTDHPANLDTFAYAVAKSLQEAEGLDHDVCEHGKCMNKDCAYKCMKCMEMGKAEDQVTNAHDSKPKEYSGVDTKDFLDTENYKYPVDEKHLMPALRYFNHAGQREAGGYSPEKWSQMGSKLASKLSAKTGDKYEYDSKSEKVTKQNLTEKEVNTVADHGNLVSKQVPAEILSFGKEWGKDIAAEMKKDDEQAAEAPAEQAAEEATAEAAAAPVEGEATVEATEEVAEGAEEKEETKEETEKASSSSDSSTSDSGSSAKPFTLGGSDSSSDSSSGSSDSDSLTSALSSLMDELKSTLESLASSMESSSNSSDSTSSDSGSTSGSTTSSDGSSSKTSTSKSSERPGSQEEANGTQDSTTTTSTGADADTLGKAIEQMTQMVNTMKQLKKAKASNKPKLDAPKGAASDMSSSDSVTPTSQSTTEVGKALTQMVEIMKELKEMQKGSVEKTEIPARKGYAVTLEKTFTGHQEVQKTSADEDMLKKLETDPEISFAEYHKYRDYGILPTKYAKEARA